MPPKRTKVRPSGYQPAPAIAEGVGSARSRLRAPYQALSELLGGAGDIEDGDAGKITTAWYLLGDEEAATPLMVHDRQDEDDRSFRVERFRRRPLYDWHVAGDSAESVERFCRWLSTAVTTWAREQPRTRRLTESSRSKINDLIRNGRSPADATREAAEWEEMGVDLGQLQWPIVGQPVDA